jgi:uncharacterized RDD family membrane protein YckC
MNLARKHSRFAAHLIDSIILGLANILIFGIIFLVFVLVAGVSLPNISNIESFAEAVGITFLIIAGLVSILISVATVIYYAYYLSKNSQTPGMKFVGIKAQKEDGTSLTFQEAAIRYIIFSLLAFVASGLAYIPYVGLFLYVPAVFGIYFWCLIDKKQQNIYDMIHHVIYVKDNENEKRSKIIIGSYFGCGCLAFILAIAAFFVVGLSTMNTGISPNIVTESYSQKSDRLQRECMEANEVKNFSSLSGFCRCTALYELDDKIPMNKKEEVKNQNCGFYRESNQVPMEQ